MRSIVVALALTSIAWPTLAGDSLDRSATVVTIGDEADGAKIPRPEKGRDDGDHLGKGCAKERDDRAKDRDEAHAAKVGKYGAFELAARLSGVETRIGIRAEQLDAWRDYTTSLQSLLALARKSENEQRAGDPHGPKDPFDREQKLADTQIEKAAAAEKLKSAIAMLRTVLTQQQLEQLASMNRWE